MGGRSGHPLRPTSIFGAVRRDPPSLRPDEPARQASPSGVRKYRKLRKSHVVFSRQFVSQPKFRDFSRENTLERTILRRKLNRIKPELNQIKPFPRGISKMTSRALMVAGVGKAIMRGVKPERFSRGPFWLQHEMTGRLVIKRGFPSSWPSPSGRRDSFVAFAGRSPFSDSIQRWSISHPAQQNGRSTCISAFSTASFQLGGRGLLCRAHAPFTNQ